jgi:hypothetical protein
MSSSLEKYEYSEVYSDMIDLWDQLALIESAKLKVCGAYIARREQQQLIQFLMTLCSDFERFKLNPLGMSPI